MIPFLESAGTGSLREAYRRSRYVFETLLIVGSFAGYASVSVLPVFTQTDSRVFTEPFRYLMVGLTVLALFRVRKDSLKRGVNLFLVLFGGLWYLLFLRILWHFFYPIQIADDKTLFEIFQFSVGGTFLPALAILLRGNPSDSATAGRLLAVILPINCLLVLYCAFFVAPQETAYIRLSIPTLNPISVGHLGVTTMILAVWRSAPRSAQSERRILAVAWKVFSAILGLSLLGLSASKGPIVAMLAVVLVAVLGRKGAWGKLRMAVRAAVVVVAGIIILVAVEQETQFKPLLRISEAVNPQQAPEQEARGDLILNSWQEFIENPLFGSGIVERESGLYSHNIMVESFMVAGILGGLLCIACVVFVTMNAWHIVVSSGEYAWIGLLFIHRLVWVQLSGSLFTASEFWASAALVMAVAASLAAKMSVETRSEERTSLAEGRA